MSYTVQITLFNYLKKNIFMFFFLVSCLFHCPAPPTIFRVCNLRDSKNFQLKKKLISFFQNLFLPMHVSFKVFIIFMEIMETAFSPKFNRFGKFCSCSWYLLFVNFLLHYDLLSCHFNYVYNFQTIILCCLFAMKDYINAISCSFHQKLF